jgi:hypothetical protein
MLLCTVCLFTCVRVFALTFTITLKIPIDELGDHISEKGSTSCIRIGAAMLGLHL